MRGMPRHARACPAGHVYHVLNRAAGRLRLFRRDTDYLAFERIMIQAHARCPIAILDWCLMPNHWHFVVQPAEDGQVTEYFRWLTHTHAMRWHAANHAVGTGALYQGRFKSFPVQHTDAHVRTVLRYVARNALRAGLVRRSALDWLWCGAHVRARRAGEPLAALLAPWPVDEPADWQRYVDQPQTPAEEEALRLAIRRSRPYGRAGWVTRTAARLGLESSLRPRGRPRRPG